MAEPLFKYLGRVNSNPEAISASAIAYEKMHMEKFSSPIATLVNENFSVGIEIEVENVSRHGCQVYGVWQVHNDGSLRDSGFEYVTVPISGWRIHFALNQFFSTMAEDIRFSPRTSIHVHLNALDMKPKQIGGLLCTYLPFEQLLYRFAGASRQYNNFCVPLMDVQGFKNLLEMFTGPRFELPNLPNHRYMGLNLDAVRKYGTLEFRHMGGTNDKLKICRWINLIFCLKRYAMSNTYEEIVNRIQRLNSDSSYMMFLDEVFGNCSWYLDTHNLQKDMELGVSRVKAITTKNQWKKDLKAAAKATSSEWVVRMNIKEKKDYFVFGAVPRVRRANRVPPPQPRVGGMGEWGLNEAVAAQQLQGGAIPPIIQRIEDNFDFNEDNP